MGLYQVVIYDPALSRGLPDWVRFGTALRGVEHAVGAVCHPQATDEHRASALRGLKMVRELNGQTPRTRSAGKF
eukprot:COSAG01_NODE_10400_length_2176_cov_2.485315_3_plen_74_part_00